MRGLLPKQPNNENCDKAMTLIFLKASRNVAHSIVKPPFSFIKRDDARVGKPYEEILKRSQKQTNDKSITNMVLSWMLNKHVQLKDHAIGHTLYMLQYRYTSKVKMEIIHVVEKGRGGGRLEADREFSNFN